MKDLYQVKSGIEDLKTLGITLDIDASLLLIKNRKEIEKITEPLDEFITPTKEFTEYETESVELIKQYSSSEPTPNGEGSLSFKIDDEKLEDFKKAKIEFENKNRGIVEMRIKQVKEFNKKIEEEVDVELTKLTPSNLPQKAEGLMSILDKLYPILDL